MTELVSTLRQLNAQMPHRAGRGLRPICSWPRQAARAPCRPGSAARGAGDGGTAVLSETGGWHRRGRAAEAPGGGEMDATEIFNALLEPAGWARSHSVGC
jgi:hypothetical protein